MPGANARPERQSTAVVATLLCLRRFGPALRALIIAACIGEAPIRAMVDRRRAVPSGHEARRAGVLQCTLKTANRFTAWSWPAWLVGNQREACDFARQARGLRFLCIVKTILQLMDNASGISELKHAQVSCDEMRLPRGRGQQTGI